MPYEYEFIKHLDGTHIKAFFTSINQRLYHWHYDLEIIFVIEGSVVINTVQNRYLLKKNDILIFNRNEIHSLSRTKETNTLLALQFDPKFCRSYYPKLQRLKFIEPQINQVIYPQHWNDIKKHLGYIVDSYDKKEEGYSLKLMGILNMLLFSLMQCVKYEHIADDKLSSQEKYLQRLNRIISFIQENYMNKITLKNLAEKENLDMYYLSHFIKRQLGISFQEYLNKVRLEKAVSLLTQTDRKHIDISIECGFSDNRYLNKMFTKEYGCTPSQYKLQYKNLDSAVSFEQETKSNNNR